MEKWIMVCQNLILDTCIASSYDEASNKFKSRSRYEDWAESDIMSEADWLSEQELNSFESTLGQAE